MGIDDAIIWACVGVMVSLVGIVACWATLSGQDTSRVATTVPRARMHHDHHQDQRGTTRREANTDQRLRGRGIKRVTVNVSTFLSEDGYIRQEIAASLKTLTQSYDVFFLAMCTSVEIREKIRRVFQLNDLLPPWLDWQHRVMFVSTDKGLASAIRQLEPDIHVSHPLTISQLMSGVF